MSNLLTAITSIVNNISATLHLSSEGSIDNRMNQMGEALEEFVKNAFANSLNLDRRSAERRRSEVFSYQGNSNNPPDAMLRGGAAIEIKKIEKNTVRSLQLNSSYPKNKLYADNPRISQRCVNCEDWDEKDMLYVVGHVDKDTKKLQSLYFVYGDIYCDDKSVYERVENKIKESLESLKNVELAPTNELGRINRVDHLGITDLRIRGMWLLISPYIHYDYLVDYKEGNNFKLVAIIPEDKYLEFENREEFENFSVNNGIDIVDEELPDPQNPSELIDTKVIKYII